jgi:hypothetical protein
MSLDKVNEVVLLAADMNDESWMDYSSIGSACIFLFGCKKMMELSSRR